LKLYYFENRYPTVSNKNSRTHVSNKNPLQFIIGKEYTLSGLEKEILGMSLGNTKYM
jgi:FKBP-type peptidyl-prolyl cis-trans isomerase 2